MPRFPTAFPNYFLLSTRRISASFKPIILWLLLLVNVSLVAVIHPSSLLAYFYFLALGLLIFKVFTGRPLLEGVAYYCCYSLLMIALYAAQFWTYPEFIGLTGGFGIGDDDSRYYLYIADYVPPQYGLQELLPMREYERTLRFLAWYPITHPFDILFVNVIPLMLIPPFTEGLAARLTGEPRVALLARRLITFCPFLLSNSLILVRDGWTTMAFAGGLLFFLTGRYLRMAVLVAVLLWLRVGSALIFFIVVGIFFFQRLSTMRSWNRKVNYAAGIALALTLAGMVLSPFILDYLQSKGFLTSFFFRGYFVSSFYERSVAQTGISDSILVGIYRQGPLIRIPFGFTYFFMAPLWVPHQIVRLGIIVPRVILQNLFALLFIVYLKYFVQAAVYAFQRKNTTILPVLLAYLVAVLAISQASIQIRHKVMVLPLLYIVVAYGYYHRTRLGAQLGTIASIFSATIQLGRTALRLI